MPVYEYHMSGKANMPIAEYTEKVNLKVLLEKQEHYKKVSLAFEVTSTVHSRNIVEQN